MILPVTTSASGAVELPNEGAGDFDCYRSFVTNAPSSEVLGFYKSELQARGWSLYSQSASNGAPEDLFQKAGNDTFYWEVGITITARYASRTAWKFTIYQESETI